MRLNAAHPGSTSFPRSAWERPSCRSAACPRLNRELLPSFPRSAWERPSCRSAACPRPNREFFLVPTLCVGTSLVPLCGVPAAEPGSDSRPFPSFPRSAWERPSCRSAACPRPNRELLPSFLRSAWERPSCRSAACPRPNRELLPSFLRSAWERPSCRSAACPRPNRELLPSFPRSALVIPENLVSWLAEFYQHTHGWSQLCSHGRQFTGPRQGNGLAHSSMGSGSAIARGGSGSWRLRRRLLSSLAR